MRVEEASAPILIIVASETPAALAAATTPGSMPPRLLGKAVAGPRPGGGRAAGG